MKGSFLASLIERVFLFPPYPPSPFPETFASASASALLFS
jgi:hypothetical protein